MNTPTDLNGNPYTPTLSYGWMTDAHRATCALHMACDPSQIEYRLDARAKMDALTSLKARMQQTLDHAQATGPNPTSQRALEYRLAEAINALASTPSPDMGRVTVKALEWEAYGGRWRASSPGITILKYIVNPDKVGCFYVSVNGQPLTGTYPSSDGAKTAAQSHFAAAIFAAIDQEGNK